MIGDLGAPVAGAVLVVPAPIGPGVAADDGRSIAQRCGGTGRTVELGIDRSVEAREEHDVEGPRVTADNDEVDHRGAAREQHRSRRRKRTILALVARQPVRPLVATDEQRPPRVATIAGSGPVGECGRRVGADDEGRRTGHDVDRGAEGVGADRQFGRALDPLGCGQPIGAADSVDVVGHGPAVGRLDPAGRRLAAGLRGDLDAIGGVGPSLERRRGRGVEPGPERENGGAHCHQEHERPSTMRWGGGAHRESDVQKVAARGHTTTSPGRAKRPEFSGFRVAPCLWRVTLRSPVGAVSRPPGPARTGCYTAAVLSCGAHKPSSSVTLINSRLE